MLTLPSTAPVHWAPGQLSPALWGSLVLTEASWLSPEVPGPWRYLGSQAPLRGGSVLSGALCESLGLPGALWGSLELSGSLWDAPSRKFCSSKTRHTKETDNSTEVSSKVSAS